MRSRVLVGLAVAAAAGLVVPGGAWAQPAPQTISGTVVNNCSTTATAGINMNLRNPDGSTAGFAYVQADGTYSFTAPGGEYTVSTYPPQGCGAQPDSTAVDSTAGPVTGIDFEMFNVYSVYGTVTGCPEADSVGASNVAVKLHDPAGAVIADTTTYPDGSYFFQWKRAAAGYVVEVIPPTGCTGDPLTETVDLSTSDADDVDFALVKTANGSSGSSGSSGSTFGSLVGPAAFGS